MMHSWHGVVASWCCLVLAASGAEGEGVGSVHRLGTAPHAQSVAVAPEAAVFVAVVPFSNISGVSSDDWIGEGIAETVRADLQAWGVTVIGRALVAAVAGPPDAGESADDGAAMRLGRQLGASWVVSGGYQRLGDQLRVTARFVEVTSGVVWRTVKVDGVVDDIFALQDRIVPALVASLDLTGSGPRLARRPGGRASPASAPVASGVAGGITLSEPAPGGPAARGGLGVASGAGILTGRPSVSATRTSTPPRVDGRLDDVVWRQATRITEFVQQQPRAGAPATEETEVFVAYDANNLFLGIYVHYSDPVLIRANLSDRDRLFNDDTISFYFDPFLDQQRAYVFSVNGYGVQGDSLLDSSGGASGGGGGGGAAAVAGAAGQALLAVSATSRVALAPQWQGRPGDSPAATHRGTRSTSQAGCSSRTGGRPSWRSRSRACGIPLGALASPTDGGSRSCGRFPARTRSLCGRRSPATLPGF